MAFCFLNQNLSWMVHSTFHSSLQLGVLINRTHGVYANHDRVVSSVRMGLFSASGAQYTLS